MKKFLLAAIGIVLIASIAGNIYFAKHQWRQEPPVVVRNYSIDEPIVMRHKGGLLEVATITNVETFQASKEHEILGVSLGKTISQIRVPAFYKYQVDLAPEWKLFPRNKRLIVIAPSAKASLPVAIDTTKLEMQASGIWSIMTGKEQLDGVLKSTSAELAVKAQSQYFIGLQRQAARKTLVEFVKKWLVSQSQYESMASYPISVFFSDEPIEVLRGESPPL